VALVADQVPYQVEVGWNQGEEEETAEEVGMMVEGVELAVVKVAEVGWGAGVQLAGTEGWSHHQPSCCCCCCCCWWWWW
jgi:hypothetical protein